MIEVLICPDTPEHSELAKRLGEAKEGELVLLSAKEIELLADIEVWPRKERWRNPT